MAELIETIAAKRGYMTITVRDRGNVPRNMKKAFNAAAKAAWFQTAKHFHSEMRDARFTPSHATEAGYTARKGQNLPQGSKAWKRSYYGRKFSSQKHGGGIGKADPLVFTGNTRRAVRTASITSTSKGGKAAYSGARVFNFRHPKSKVNMADEFRRITPRESIKLAFQFDKYLDESLKKEDGA